MTTDTHCDGCAFCNRANIPCSKCPACSPSGMVMLSDRAGETESGALVDVGTRCLYEGHVPGGMVRVKLPGGAVEIVHPGIFPNFR